MNGEVESQMVEDVYIGIGSNLRNPLENCRRAITLISMEKGIRLIRASSFYRTEPVGVEGQPWFVNAVIQVRTGKSPELFLESLQKIEVKMGRRKKAKWAPRIIDLDILLFGERVIESEGLVVPHPCLHMRRFALEPLCEIAPDFVHPRLNISIRAIFEKLKDDKKVFKIDPEGWEDWS